MEIVLIISILANICQILAFYSLSQKKRPIQIRGITAKRKV